MIEIIHCQQLSLYIYTILKTAALKSNKALYMLLVELELDVIVPGLDLHVLEPWEAVSEPQCSGSCFRSLAYNRKVGGSLRCCCLSVGL